MSWDFDAYRFDRNNTGDREIKESEILQDRRQELLESIAQAANDIKRIDNELAALSEEATA